MFLVFKMHYTNWYKLTPTQGNNRRCVASILWLKLAWQVWGNIAPRLWKTSDKCLLSPKIWQYYLSEFALTLHLWRLTVGLTNAVLLLQTFHSTCILIMVLLKVLYLQHTVEVSWNLPGYCDFIHIFFKSAIMNQIKVFFPIFCCCFFTDTCP